jgi:hypothetical protein
VTGLSGRHSPRRGEMKGAGYRIRDRRLGYSVAISPSFERICRPESEITKKSISFMAVEHQ